MSITAPTCTVVSVVVPCFNESAGLPQLAERLASLQAAMADDHRVRFILVDDGSSDGTWAAMNLLFGSSSSFALQRHERNRGIAAAILTGLRQADTEIVCSIDSDCTYDLHELKRMIPLLTQGVDLVTASPYHPQGQVRNVPAWRLRLSKGAACLYRMLLRQRLFTHTSCFRVYRRSAVVDLPIKHSGFEGVTELLARLDLHGSKIVEHPATLDVRKHGRSKMRILRTIFGHLALMTGLLGLRLVSQLSPRWKEHRWPVPSRAPALKLEPPQLERTTA